jgi:hypothetical protein
MAEQQRHWTAVGQAEGQAAPAMGDAHWRRWAEQPVAVVQIMVEVRQDRRGASGEWERRGFRPMLYHVAFTGERPSAITFLGWLNETWERQFGRAPFRNVAIAAEEVA